MATTFVATRAAATFPVFKGEGSGALCVAYGTYEIAANPTAGDIYQMCRVPAGAVVVGGWIYADDLDTNATETLDMDIGWAANGVEAADPDGFGNLAVWVGDAFANPNIAAVAGNMIPLQGVLLATGPQAFSRETIIEIVCNVTAATGGTGTLSVVVLYAVP